MEYVRGGADLGRLIPTRTSQLEEAPAPPGAVLDAITDRCRRGPLLLVIDDMEWMRPTGIAALEAVAGAAERLSLLLVLIADPAQGGAAVGALRRVPNAATTTVGPLPDDDLARIVTADGVDEDAVAATVAVAGGLPGVARREAAAWAERAASDRLQTAAVSSIDASAVAEQARASVFDDVLALVAARARRDELVSASLAGRHPYRALAAYGPEDADLFVGRERLVAELAARVLDRRLVAVVGASGSGKSSLVRAGLLPLVRSGRLPGTGAWRAAVVVPGDDALAALDGVADLDEPGPQLVIVDQFEEAIAGGTAEALANRLIDLVLDAALDIHVVLVVRADQYAALTMIRPLAELIEDAQAIVGPPTDDELRRIIEVPARRTGCLVERSLTDLVLDEVGDYDAALPLVSAALAEVWEHREADTLTVERYVEIGGIAAAVERLGERAVERTGDEESIRKVMMRLVDVTDDGQWVRRRLAVEDVAAELGPAVDALADVRLVQRGEREVDVVHEVVFRAWPRLVNWLEEARADLVLGRELRFAARAWDAQGRSDDDVYRGARLALAREFAARHQATEVVAEFVAAGQRVADRAHEELGRQLERESRARRRRANEAASLAEERRRDAEAARVAAEDEQSRNQVARLVAESGRELDGRLDLALLLAVEAHRRDQTTETNGALLAALTHNTTAAERSNTGEQYATHSNFIGFLAGPARVQHDVEISADGRIVASGGTDESGRAGLALVFDTTTRALIRRIDAIRPIVQLDVSDDGRHVLTRDVRGAVELVDVEAGSSQSLGSGWQDAFFRPKRDQFVLGKHWELTLWDIASAAPVDVQLPDSPDGLAGFARDGTLFVAGPAAVAFWDIDRGIRIRRVELELALGPTQFAVSANHKFAAGADDEDRIVQVWDLRTGELRGFPLFRPGAASAFTFSPTSRSNLAIASTGGGVSLYDIDSLRVIHELHGHSAGTRDLAFSANGRYLVTIADDGLIGLWGLNRKGGPIATVLDDLAMVPSYSSDGRLLVVRAGDAVEVRERARPRAHAVGPVWSGTWPLTPELSADGSKVLLFNEKGDEFVADTATGETIWSPDPEALGPDDVSMSPDARTVAEIHRGDPDYVDVVQVLDVRSGRTLGRTPLAEFAPDDAVVSGQPRFSSDSRFLDIPTNLGVARVGARNLRPVSFVDVDHEVMGVSDVPGTNDVIGVGGGGRLWRWDMATAGLVAEGRSRNSSSLTNVAVSADGTMIAAYHPLSAALALFDGATLRPIGLPVPTGDVPFTPRFTPDGRHVAGNGPFNTWTEWDIDPDAWQEAVCRAAGRNLTRDEWAEYIGADEKYRATCPDWPLAR